MEWEKYSIDQSGDKHSPSRPVSLENVYHIVHVRDGFPLVERGKIKAGIVYDESKMRNTRTHVIWLSPNWWIDGSLYGSVRFGFEWDRLVNGRQLYWVEAMNYPIPAPRFILTDQTPPPELHLAQYDPENDDGPLRKVNGRWEWNPSITLEIMYEGDLPIAQCNAFDFVAHNSKICRAYKSQCEERDVDIHKPWGRFVAYLFGTQNDQLNGAMLQQDGRVGHPNFSIEAALTNLYKVLLGKGNLAGPMKDRKEIRILLRCAMLMYGVTGKSADARALIKNINSDSLFDDEFCRIAGKHFNTPSYKLS